MSETTLDSAPAPVFKMTMNDTVSMLQSYLGQADKSLTTLQATVDDLTNKLNEARKMQLILIGQKQLIVDLLNKSIEAPKSEEKAAETK